MELFEKLKELSFRYVDKKNYFDFNFLGEVKNWPNGNDGSPQGKEEFTCIALEKDHMIVHCGSSWQRPIEIEIRCDDNDSLYCSRNETVEVFQNVGISLFDVLDTIFDKKSDVIFGSKLIDELKSLKELQKNGISNSSKKTSKNITPIERPENVPNFREHLNDGNYTPNQTVENKINQNETPFNRNIFFRYNAPLLGADEFNRCVDILLRRNGNREGSPMEAMQLMGELLRDEYPFREQLSEIAINLVREMYNVPNTIDLKAMIKQNNEPQGGAGGDLNRDEIPEERKLELQDEIEKRRILNSIVHGCAVHQWTGAYHLVREELDNLNPILIDKYNRLSGIVNYWNWKMYQEDMVPPVTQGINQIDLEKKEINASALNFPVLIHELSKGVIDFLISIGIPKEVNGVDITESELRYIYAEADNYSHEQWHYFFGPTLWRAMLHTADVQSQDLPPIVSKMAQMSYVELSNFCINIVFDTEGKGKEEMEKMLQELEG